MTEQGGGEPSFLDALSERIGRVVEEKLQQPTNRRQLLFRSAINGLSSAAGVAWGAVLVRESLKASLAPRPDSVPVPPFEGRTFLTEFERTESRAFLEDLKVVLTGTLQDHMVNAEEYDRLSGAEDPELIDFFNKHFRKRDYRTVSWTLDLGRLENLRTEIDITYENGGITKTWLGIDQVEEKIPELAPFLINNRFNEDDLRAEDEQLLVRSEKITEVIDAVKTLIKLPERGYDFSSQGGTKPRMKITYARGERGQISEVAMNYSRSIELTVTELNYTSLRGR